MSAPETLRDARERSRMTLRGAAPRLGIDFTYLSKVENGHERPSDALVRKMGALYGFDPSPWLLRRAVADTPDEVRDAIIAAARAESDTLRAERDAWQEEARRYAQNADYWRERSDALRADNERLRIALDRALLQWSMHADEARINDPEAHGEYPIHKANDIKAQLYREASAALAPSPAEPAAPEREP